MSESSIRYLIFGRLDCPFCTMAIDLCKASHYSYLFLDLSTSPDIELEHKQYYNHSTIPIILANDKETGFTKRVGGYTDLLESIRE